MKYMGSKRRFAQEHLQVIAPYLNGRSLWVEPFVGGANMIEHVTIPRYGSDSHDFLIALLQAAAQGWLPTKQYTEQDYNLMKARPLGFPAHEVGYVGFALSYGGKWFGGWRRDRIGRRNYVAEAARNALVQFPRLRGCVFRCHDYTATPIPDNAIVYCDPPYEGTTSYAQALDYSRFWDWAEHLAAPCFVCSYTAPNLEWVPVWQKRVTSSLTADTGAKQAVEKLFLHTRHVRPKKAWPSFF